MTKKLDASHGINGKIHLKNYNISNYNSTLHPGEYYSTVTSMEFISKYPDQTNLLIKYQLTSKQTNELFDFKETFIWDYSIRRTRIFIDYLAETEITPDNIEDFAHYMEEVTIAEVEVGDKLFKNIVKRNIMCPIEEVTEE